MIFHTERLAPFVIGGQRYNALSAEAPAAAYHNLERLCTSIGFEQVAPEEGDDAERFIGRLRARLEESGRADELAAAILWPANMTPQPWRLDVFERTAKRIAAARSPTDRAIVDNVVDMFVRHAFRRDIERIGVRPKEE